MACLCPTCGRSFDTALDQRQHAKAKRHARLPRPEREESMAEMVIAARLRHLSGGHVEEWLGDMFHDDIYGEEG